MIIINRTSWCCLLLLLVIFATTVLSSIAGGNQLCTDKSCANPNLIVSSTRLRSFIQNIPILPHHPLGYVMETLKIQQNDTLWLVFGVYKGNSLNYISMFTRGNVIGFDSFIGLPEDWREGFPKGTYSTNNQLPQTMPNALPIMGPFNSTVRPTLKIAAKKISFIHMDCDLYNSTKYALIESKDYLDKGCVIVFGAFLNYEEFDGKNGALRAFYEFIEENQIRFEWIGKDQGIGQSVAVRILFVPDQPVSFRSLEEIARSKELTTGLDKIPDRRKWPIDFLFKTVGFTHQPGTLWLEFGVFSGNSINFIAQHTEGLVHGFDTFEGLPEDWREGFQKGQFNRNGNLPRVLPNVRLYKGLFQDTLIPFLEDPEQSDQSISFLHIDCDLYSGAKFILDSVKDRLSSSGCVVIFDELVNYEGFDGENGELRAWHEFVNENEVDYEWIGMNGFVGVYGYYQQAVALIIHSIAPLQSPTSSPPPPPSPVVTTAAIMLSPEELRAARRALLTNPAPPTDLRMKPLQFVFQSLKLQRAPNSLWLEFGVYEGSTISYIANFTEGLVHGFDTFRGLPEDWRPGYERGDFDRQGELPNNLPKNVRLIKGLFQDTLIPFLEDPEQSDQSISFLHIDCDLYSGAKFILDSVKDRLSSSGCVVIFDELVNYEGFDGENGELRAWHEFVNENEVDYEWIGMKGSLSFDHELYGRQSVALRIHSVKPKKSPTLIPSPATMISMTADGPRRRREARESLRASRRQLVSNLPDLAAYPLHYLLERQKISHPPYTSWLQFGVFEGLYVNAMARAISPSNSMVFAFDHFFGMEEDWRPGYPKGFGSRQGIRPALEPNVVLYQGNYQESLPVFLQLNNETISFIHMHTAVYSLTKFILDSVKDRLSLSGCVVIFDELVNYEGFDGENGELRAWHEFVNENEVDYEWIGMNGRVYWRGEVYHQSVALRIHSVRARA